MNSVNNQFKSRKKIFDKDYESRLLKLNNSFDF